MRHTLKTTKLIAIFAVGFTMTLPAQLSAESAITTDEKATQIFNIAGHQRMLSQRIAKLACFTARGIDPANYQEQLAQTRSLLEQLQGAAPEKNANLNPVQETKVSFRKPVYNASVKNNADNNPFLYGSDQKLNVLDLANREVFKITQANVTNKKDTSVALTITADIAGRQQMLLQKMVKDVCFLGVSNNVDTVAESLSDSIDLFDTSLTALRFGYTQASVLEAPNQDIATALETVSNKWDTVKPMFETVASGKSVSSDQLIEIEKLTEVLFNDMDKAAILYQQI